MTSRSSARSSPRERVHRRRAPGERDVVSVVAVLIRGSRSGCCPNWGLACCRSVSRALRRAYSRCVPVRPPYVTSSKVRAAVRRRSACAGSTRPASLAASPAVRPGPGVSSARSSRARTIARMRSWTAWLQRAAVACAWAAERCSAAVRGVSVKSVPPVVGVRRTAPSRIRRATTSRRTKTAMARSPIQPPGVVPEAVSSSSPTRSQNQFRARWIGLGSCWWYRGSDSSAQPPRGRGRVESTQVCRRRSRL